MPMNRDRLRHLVTVLERVRDQRLAFNLANWVGSRTPAEGSKENSCGTVCCAFGWAAFDPEFNEQGLRIQTSWDEEERACPILTGDEHRQRVRNDLLPPSVGVPKFEDETGMGAAQKFFGLTAPQARHLFIPSEYLPLRTDQITTNTVIGRIEALLRNNGTIKR